VVAPFQKTVTEDEIVAANQRYGTWTRLELVDMDVRFCQAVQRAHPKFTEPPVQVGGSVLHGSLTDSG
jgi:hypothetical protein